MLTLKRPRSVKSLEIFAGALLIFVKFSASLLRELVRVDGERFQPKQNAMSNLVFISPRNEELCYQLFLQA
jgi:hypothetical protein